MGLFIDENLNWKEQIKYASTRIRIAIHKYIRLKKSVLLKTLKKITLLSWNQFEIMELSCGVTVANPV